MIDWFTTILLMIQQNLMMAAMRYEIITKKFLKIKYILFNKYNAGEVTQPNAILMSFHRHF